MAVITHKGRELFDKLAPSIGVPFGAAGICSLVCRQAKLYCRIQEDWCSKEMTDQERCWTERKEFNIEFRIKKLISELPEVDGKPIEVLFGGDPRGHTVKLLMPDGRYDSWGGVEHGIGVPGS